MQMDGWGGEMKCSTRTEDGKRAVLYVDCWRRGKRELCWDEDVGTNVNLRGESQDKRWAGTSLKRVQNSRGCFIETIHELMWIIVNDVQCVCVTDMIC